MTAMALSIINTILQCTVQPGFSFKTKPGVMVYAAPGSTSLLLRRHAKSNDINFSSTRSRIRCSTVLNTISVANSVSESASGGSLKVDCVIVGGGISGLCIAQALSTKHASVSLNFIVTEARDCVGGNITTLESDGYLWEEGPNSFQPSDPVLTMAVDSGLKEDLVLGDPNAPRFVLWNSKLRPVPSKPTDLPFFDLMSFSGKIKAGLGALGFRPSPPGHEESVEEFVRRNLGDEVFERLIEPFCSGVYAGDPAKLSMKAAFGKVWSLEQKGGSIIGGTFKTIQERRNNPKAPRDPRLPKPKGQTVGSFRKGLIMLPNAISASAPWGLCPLQEYHLTYETPEGLVSVRSKSVVLTVPSHVASILLRPLSVSTWAFQGISVAHANLHGMESQMKRERIVPGDEVDREQERWGEELEAVGSARVQAYLQ
ncbi:hypothetical protein Cgig2_029735 [Carnegiea gigantea]|uniref:Protoporphyrinogen oxidase n=1 Tax=Carnegiea gigantea TaxID=171969 RepID=A0A9Q1GMA5_9CARY|nr:hypothetical protein Cgig2_029735 [Carnegiea gigantea]